MATNDTINVNVKSWQEPYKTLLKARNHYWMVDEPVEIGGKDSAPKPSEFLLGALGACISITIEMYCARKGWTLEQVEVQLSMDRSASETKIKKKLLFKGNLDEDQRKRLMQIAQACPIHKILTNPIVMETIED
ncbi:MAG TPA: OsmC family protein [Bacteroidia bacterium]|nr:OsmC family protein [Bacteroidia bacterium]HNT80180.1 OsmC family protein [Bacteroidia bacterium]